MSGVTASALWLLLTLALYAATRFLQLKYRKWWLGPAVLVAPILVAATLATSTDYPTYLRYNVALIFLLGPATVAFAQPVWAYREIIRRYWPILLSVVLIGSLISLVSGYMLSRLFHLPVLLQQSLLPRSMTSPFAMPFAEAIGGDGSLAALFVIVVGIIGGILGGIMLRLPVDNPVARGLMLGISAHGVGTAYARELGEEEGAISALAMILMGLANILGLALLILFTS